MSYLWFCDLWNETTIRGSKTEPWWALLNGVYNEEIFWIFSYVTRKKREQTWTIFGNTTNGKPRWKTSKTLLSMVSKATDMSRRVLLLDQRWSVSLDFTIRSTIIHRRVIRHILHSYEIAFSEIILANPADWDEILHGDSDQVARSPANSWCPSPNGR